MKMRAIWFGILGLLIVVATNLLLNILSLVDAKETLAKGAAPEDILGYGIAPVWAAVCGLLGLILFLGNKYLRRQQLAIVLVGFLVLFIADWAAHLKLLATMGL